MFNVVLVIDRYSILDIWVFPSNITTSVQVSAAFSFEIH